MTKFLRSFLPLLALSALLTGCSLAIPVSEVMQQPQGAALYTRFNLWYTDPAAVDSLNIQQGRMVPIGTRITPIRADERSFTFQDEAGARYTIDFDPGLRMCSMRDFLRLFLTVDPPETTFAAIRPEVQPFIRRGEVVPGMNRAEVTMAYGPAPACRTPSTQNETWIYWIGPEQTIRVSFRNDKVRNIINTNEQ